jgi:hypothetical protein
MFVVVWNEHGFRWWKPINSFLTITTRRPGHWDVTEAAPTDAHAAESSFPGPANLNPSGEAAVTVGPVTVILRLSLSGRRPWPPLGRLPRHGGRAQPGRCGGRRPGARAAAVADAHRLRLTSRMLGLPVRHGDRRRQCRGRRQARRRDRDRTGPGGLSGPGGAGRPDSAEPGLPRAASVPASHGELGPNTHCQAGRLRLRAVTPGPVWHRDTGSA